MKLHRVGGVCGGVGLALLLGACQVEVGKMPPPQPGGGQPLAWNNGGGGGAGTATSTATTHTNDHPSTGGTPATSRTTPPVPSTQKTPTELANTHVTPPPPPTPRVWIAPALPPPAPVSMRFPTRIVHPMPLPNPGQAHLVIPGIVLKPGRKCGPYQLGGGHWVHLDCNVHVALTKAKPASVEARKIVLMRSGKLKLDSAVKGTGPDSVDHRNDGTEGPIKDQGQVGSCTSFSLSSAMDNAIRRQNKQDTMSSLHIWSHYGFPNMRSAGDANVNKPIADWSVWPYDERIACELDQSGEPGGCGPYNPPVTQGAGPSDPQVQASEKSADAAAQWKVTEYDAIPTDPDSLATVLASGSDVWFSMEIGNSWMNPNGDTIADWNDSSIDGGHAVLFSGYRTKNGQRQFLVHNSWGKDWADNGFAYISEAMVKAYIKSAYKVVVASAAAPPPPPNDPNALTDDDCAGDQLVDSVTGQCAEMCPDDSRPANGKCVGAAATHH